MESQKETLAEQKTWNTNWMTELKNQVNFI